MSVSVCVLCVYLNRDLHSTVVLNIESVSLPLESQNIDTFFFKQSIVCNYLSLQMSWQERTFCPNVWDHN